MPTGALLIIVAAQPPSSTLYSTQMMFFTVAFYWTQFLIHYQEFWAKNLNKTCHFSSLFDLT